MIRPLTESRIERRGIKPGTMAPDFTLPSVTGPVVSLRQYQGQRVVLVFTDPHCGPCNQLGPYLVRAYHRRTAKSPAIIIIARGDPVENRKKAEEQGFEFPVVVQHRWKLSREYGIFKTPVAFLIGDDGRILRPVAVGLNQIRNLLYEESPPGIRERLTATADAISHILSRPIPRREAIRTAGLMLASTAFGVIGMPKAARAFTCAPGETPCGVDCCEEGWQCCAGECCPSQVMCCNGSCCAPSEVCIDGKCQQQVLP